jgi:hypothetical protein
MRIFTYWTYSKNTGAIVEQKFRNGQMSDRGWFVETDGEYVGLSLVKADTLVKEWNRLGNKNGYFYYLHQPEAF